MNGELIVSSPDEITRERLEAEATLLDSVVRETECEAVTEREDTYQVIIDSGGNLTGLKYALGKIGSNVMSTEYKKGDNDNLIYSFTGGRHLRSGNNTLQGCSGILDTKETSKLSGSRRSNIGTGNERALHPVNYLSITNDYTYPYQLMNIFDF